VVFQSDVGDDGAHPVDVVGHDDAAEGLDEGHDDGLEVVLRHDVAEPHRQHHVGRPVERPHVDHQPVLPLDALVLDPVRGRVDVGHQDEDQRDYVGVAEVD